MGDITQALRTAQSGLLTNQQALNTVSNNIANVNTEGYSRKLTNFKSVSIAGTGAGVRISEITRRIDEGLLKSLRLESSELQKEVAQETYYARIQETFGAPGDNTSISHLIESFAEAAELLATSPDQTIEQAELVRRGEDIAAKFRSMTDTIQDLRLQADQFIAEGVTEISTITASIDELNDEIISNSSVGRDVTDLQDLRDLEIDKLAKLVDISYFSRSDGDVVIFTQGGRTIVDTVPPAVTHTSASSLTATSTHSEGDISPIYVGTQIAANDITNELKHGALKGLIDIRDQILPDLQSQLDTLAAQLRDQVNLIHNRSTPFPGVQSATGTRSFISSSTQTITMGGASNNDDVAIILFDSSGEESAKTTLETIMRDTTLGDASDKGDNGPWTIDEIASRLQGWLRLNGAASATAAVDSTGKFSVTLNTTALNLNFRDETETTNGSTAEDISIAFDSNGDGVTDESHSGFSNFLGLNDFFTSDLTDNIWESDVLTSSYTSPTSSQTITFRDSTGSLGSITVAASTSLTDLATQITNNVTNVDAAVLNDGAGVRLRISHSLGTALTVTQASGNTLLTDAGIDVADVRVSTVLEVRSDLISTPGKISTGLAQWDSTKGAGGEYIFSVGDDTIATSLANTLSSNITFKQAGGLASLESSFAQYAASILSNNASLADINDRNIDTQTSLVESLQFKSDSVRGVNIDEELADLLVFEQAFAAAARVISVIQDMFDALERAIT
ncbi:MAG: flagellar hook-associated protein FlgK [Rhodospirillaceae bacterium TMED8]|nr:flagellar hook-associated protein FlgK [Magnetovibrio sp.]OUT50130.1 MAG: flagellar hook-associated protein FlgK [Rhodospirillaceae bacterium TMED8]